MILAGKSIVIPISKTTSPNIFETGTFTPVINKTPNPTQTLRAIFIEEAYTKSDYHLISDKT